MLRRYPDAEATMGEARLVGETGPDEAGSTLTPTTVKVRILDVIHPYSYHKIRPLDTFFILF